MRLRKLLAAGPGGAGRSHLRWPAVAWSVAAVLALAPSGVLAQETTTDDRQVIEEIVVVGSLITRRVVYEGSAPVQTLDAGLFESSGAAQPADMLKSLTANTGSYIATQQNSLQGSSQFNLRGLGLSSTLTLINGRRAGLAPVANDVGHGFFDINTLPLGMIERVEILRDGASATYGSQAVAGVANIVTRKGFQGLEFFGGYRSATNTAYDAGFASGFGLPQGHVNLYGAWHAQDENFRTDFDWMIPRAVDPDGDGDIVDGSFDSGRGSPGSFRRVMTAPDGRYFPFQVGGVNAPHSPDPDCRAGGGYPSDSLCRLDFTDQRTMIAAEQRAQLFTEAEFQLSERLTVLSEVGHSFNKIGDRVGNMLLVNGNVEGTNEIFVPASHPFNFWTDPDGDGTLTHVAPADWIPGVHEAVPLGYLGRPLGAEASGHNAGHEKRRFNNLRALLGAEAALPGDWTGTFHIVHSRSRLRVNADRHWEAKEFSRVVAEGLWNPFGTRLTAPDLVTPKTVADDGLAPSLTGKRAGNDAGTLRQFESVREESAKSTMEVVEFVASGDLMEWRGQPLSVAAGAQYRHLHYSRQPDPLDAIAAGPRDVPEFPVAADQHVWAAFAEGLTYFGHRTELQVALRHESYDRAGSTTDPKVSALFAATDWLSLRASWGTSFQAPSVFQAAGNTASRTLTDPFRFDARGVGRCTVDPSGAILERGDNFASPTVLRGALLQPQTADMANFGVLFRPLDSTALSVDYWAIDYRNVIAQGRSFQAILEDDCRDDGMPNDPRVSRDPSGQIVRVTTDYENIAVVQAQGLDMNAYWDVETPGGHLRIGADATLLTRYDVGNAGGDLSDQLGTRNDTNGFGPTPELRFNLSLAGSWGAHDARLTLRYIDSYKNDEVPTLPEISSWTTLDLNYGYSFAGPANGETTISLGAINLTDEDPPPLPSGRTGAQRYNLRPGYDGFVHDIRGRVMYARVNWRK